MERYGRKINLVPIEFSAKPGVTARCPSCWRVYSVEEQIQMAFRLHLDTPDY